ncbi:MAG: hypothetical protein FWG14_09520 [Peptococcaceae bacterium]|nr:hypothetical protein [Peptococcaceae bacterium]
MNAAAKVIVVLVALFLAFWLFQSFILGLLWFCFWVFRGVVFLALIVGIMHILVKMFFGFDLMGFIKNLWG